MSDPADRVQIGSKASQGVQCAQCQQQVPAGQYYSYKGRKGADVFLCSTCRDKMEQVLQAETKNPNLVGALVLGVLAGLVASGIWYAIVALTGYEIGYVAIGIGYLIGHAVHIGSGRKRMASLQLLSGGIALFSLLVAKYFTFLYFVRKALLEQKTQGYDGHFFFISPLYPIFLQNLVSPIGLLIWAFALYIAFSIPKPRTL